MTSDGPLEVLLLCDRPPRAAPTVHDHIDALTGLSRHRVRAVEILGDAPQGIDFDRFDVVAVHYTLVMASDTYVSPALRARLRESRAIKAAFIQDEYRHIDATVAAMQAIGIDVLFTCMPPDAVEAVYSPARLPGVVCHPVLTGYVPERLLTRRTRPLAERPVDVGYRARRVPAWLGDLGQEKWNIGQRFAADAVAYDLKCDMAYREEERLEGEHWLDFVAHCKAMLGVESGSSVFDFSGAVAAAVDRDVLADPAIGYDELKRRHFAHLDGLIDQRQISPRCFEAAALRTLLVLYEGNYSGLLQPWRHYVPLRKDHADMDEVVAVLRDLPRAQEIVDRAYREIACNPANQYAAHVAAVDRALAEAHEVRVGALRAGTRAGGYTDAAFDRLARPEPSTRRRRFIRGVIQHSHHLLYRVLLRPLPEHRRDRVNLWLSARLAPVFAYARRLLGSRAA